MSDEVIEAIRKRVPQGRMVVTSSLFPDEPARARLKARGRVSIHLEPSLAAALRKRAQTRGATLTEEILDAVHGHLVRAEPEDIKRLDRAVSRVHRDLNIIAQRVDAAHLHLAVLLAMLKARRDSRSAKPGGRE